MPDDLTIGMLSSLLNVSTRTIERAIASGRLVPTSLTKSGRARFSAEYAEKVRLRAEADRAKGRRSLFTKGRKPRPKPIMTAQQWVRMTLWKRRNLMPRDVRGKTTVASEPPSWSPEQAAEALREMRRKGR
jgi:hypothetical protein